MAYKLLESADDDISQLKNNISLFKQGISPNPTYRLLNSDSAIQCLLLNSNTKAKQTAGHLQNAGFDVRAILSPTVPQGTERIRICIHSFNTAADINQLTATINTFINAE
jgi:8-amino-7-oxononanoate synthase